MNTRSLLFALVLSSPSAALADCPCRYTAPGMPGISSAKPIPPQFYQCLKYQASVIADYEQELRDNHYRSDVGVMIWTPLTQSLLAVMKRLDWGVPSQADAQSALKSAQKQISDTDNTISRDEKELSDYQNQLSALPAEAPNAGGDPIDKFNRIALTTNIENTKDELVHLKRDVFRNQQVVKYWQCVITLNLPPTERK